MKLSRLSVYRRLAHFTGEKDTARLEETQPEPGSQLCLQAEFLCIGRFGPVGTSLTEGALSPARVLLAAPGPGEGPWLSAAVLRSRPRGLVRDLLEVTLIFLSPFLSSFSILIK